MSSSARSLSATMKMIVWPGGSSSVLSSAFWAGMPSVSASSIIATRRAPRLGRVPSRAISWRTCSISTSLRPSARARPVKSGCMPAARPARTTRNTRIAPPRSRPLGAASTEPISRLAHRAILHPATEAGTGRAFAQERMREAARYHSLAHPARTRQQVGVRGTGEKFAFSRSIVSRLPRTPSSGISGPPTARPRSGSRC